VHGTLAKKKKTLCNQHNIHNLRVVEALLFLGIYGKSKNSQYFGKKLKIWGGGGGKIGSKLNCCRRLTY